MKEILVLQNIVKPLFEEIRNKRLVEWSSEPYIKPVKIYRDNFWGRQVDNGYIYKKLSDFTPAFIKNDLEEIPHIKIQFNNFERHYSEVRIGIVDDIFCLGLLVEDKISYVPIEKGKLKSTIYEAIKNPPIKY